MAAASIYFDFPMEAQLAELSGILEGMKLALRWGCLNLQVEESDCQLAINFITKKSIVWNDVEAVVMVIWELIPFFINITFKFVPRQYNKEADLLAKYARIKMANETWIDQSPRWMYNWTEYGPFFGAQGAL